MPTIDRPGTTLHQAIIELDEEFSGLDRLLAALDPDIRAESLAESPRGYVWYSLTSNAVDFLGRERSISAVLQRLRHASQSGRLPSFRVIMGDRVAPSSNRTELQHVVAPLASAD